MTTPVPSPVRRLRRAAAAVGPTTLLASVLVAGPAGAQSGQPPSAGFVSAAAAAVAPVAHAQSAARSPDWSFSRDSFFVLVVAYLGIGALAAAGIWSYLRRGRW